MIALDTNLLLRYLTQDDPVQSPKATRVLQRLTEEEPGFVSLVTILEIVWVRKSIYKRTPHEIANEIEMILAADTLEVQNEQEVYQGRSCAQSNRRVRRRVDWRPWPLEGLFRNSNLRCQCLAATAWIQAGLLISIGL